MDNTQNPNMVPQKRGLDNGPSTRSKRSRTDSRISRTIIDDIGTGQHNAASTQRNENSTAEGNIENMEHSRAEFMMTDAFKEWVKSLEERDERERIRREEREEIEEIERMRRDERERERNQIRKEEQEEKRKEEMKSYLGRQIKDFNGSPEVYVSWKHNVQAVLTDSTLSPKDKLKCLSLKLVGEAMHMVPEANNLNSPEELFEFIDKALRKSSARLYAECKQKVGESVLSFSLRLTGLMKALSQDTKLETTPLYKQQLTHLFRTGLDVNIQRELKTAYILDYEELLRQALVYEDEVILHKMDKTRTGQLYHVSTEG
jgi:hypothetical protein